MPQQVEDCEELQPPLVEDEVVHVADGVLEVEERGVLRA